jgi:hypothetical protein
VDQARVLRDKAVHCLSLSLGLRNAGDIASFEALAAEFNQLAEARESAADGVLFEERKILELSPFALRRSRLMSVRPIIVAANATVARSVPLT